MLSLRDGDHLYLRVPDNPAIELRTFHVVALIEQTRDALTPLFQHKSAKHHSDGLASDGSLTLFLFPYSYNRNGLFPRRTLRPASPSLRRDRRPGSTW